MRWSALLIDLDGTLYSGDTPFPGAVEGLQRLATLNVPRRYLTNTTRMSRRTLAERLRGMGFAIDAEEIFTAPRAAAALLASRGARRIALHLPESTREDFPGFEIVEEGAEAVVVGDLGEGWSFERLNRAFQQLLEGAELIALQKNRYWNTGSGLALDAGPFVVALEFASGTAATVVGKPTREFFRLAAQGLETHADRVLVIGDDVEADVGGAQGAGMRGALVRTGKYRPEVVERSGIQPDLEAPDFGTLVAALL